MVAEMVGKSTSQAGDDVVSHPFYRAYFQCWNEQKYYEAHDVLEHVWLNKDSEDDNFFKGLIQAAGAFVHLQKNFEQPSHAKHSRRLPPATRLFELALRNLQNLPDEFRELDLVHFRKLLAATREEIIASNFHKNPWSPQTAPRLRLG